MNRDEESPLPAPDEQQEPPPILGTWTKAYALVLGELAVAVVLLYVLSRWAE